MTVTYTIVNERPSTDVAWYPITADMQSRIDHFKSTGDIVSFDIVQNSDLKSTGTLVFRDTAAETAVVNDPDWLAFLSAMKTNYSNDLITHTETRTVE